MVTASSQLLVCQLKAPSGTADLREFGLGDAPTIPSPAIPLELPVMKGKAVATVSSGDSFTLLLLRTGMVYSFGDVSGTVCGCRPALCVTCVCVCPSLFSVFLSLFYSRHVANSGTATPNSARRRG